MKARLAAAMLMVALTSGMILVSPVSAGVIVIPGIVVTGTATCDLPTGHGTYQLDWTVRNQLEDPVVVTSAVQSGAWAGPVTVAPSPIPPDGGTGTASDGPVPGDTVGTVTLTVTWHAEEGAEGTDTAVGTIELDGDCICDEPLEPTTTEERAQAVARPAFTG
jgi:hypothetical protein